MNKKARRLNNDSFVSILIFIKKKSKINIIKLKIYNLCPEDLSKSYVMDSADKQADNHAIVTKSNHIPVSSPYGWGH